MWRFAAMTAATIFLLIAASTDARRSLAGDGLPAASGAFATGQFAPQVAESRDDWRRTAFGWEHSSAWKIDREAPTDRASFDDFVHPAAIAVLQALLSLGALLSAQRT